MLYLYGLGAILCLLLWVWYKLFVSPKQMMKWQAEAFRKRGYEVLEMDYDFFKPSYFKVYDVAGRTNDSYGFAKENFPKVDVVIMNVFNSVAIDLTNVDLVKDFVSSQKVYIYHKKSMFLAAIERIVGRSLVSSEDNEWKKKRKILNQTFNFDFIKSLIPQMVRICDQSLQMLEKQNELMKQGEQAYYEYFLLNYGIGLTSKVMIECFFGKKYQEDKIDGVDITRYLIKLIEQTAKQGVDIKTLFLGRGFLELGLRKKDRIINEKIRKFREWGHKVLEEKMKEIETQTEVKNDLISTILQKRKVQNSEQKIFDNESILQEFNGFYVAGTDSTSHYLMMMIYLLAKHPETEKKVREEINYFVKGDEDFNFEQLKKCTYIDCVQKQTTRIYGPANAVFRRNALQDNSLNQVPIKKGSLVAYNVLSFHYSEKYYKNPKQFNPDRWLEQCKDIPSFALGGFGGGGRSCIGKQLAKMEAKVGLIKFLKRYKKIVLPKTEWKMSLHFMYQPEEFKTKFYL